MRILLIADIHGNFPAVHAIDDHFTGTRFDYIVNCGDSLVYAPFSNEVINWLITVDAISILGNTDKKVIKLLQGKTIKKPAKFEKHIMYTHAAEQLSKRSSDYLQSLGIFAELRLNPDTTDTSNDKSVLGIFHGSPAKPHEFLFNTSPKSRFIELASAFPYTAIVTGHSHTPYHFEINGTHFINPGSAGRMFDGDPTVSCAVLEYERGQIAVHHHRIAYDIKQVNDELARQQLPAIYQTMYTLGKKLN